MTSPGKILWVDDGDAPQAAEVLSSFGDRGAEVRFGEGPKRRVRAQALCFESGWQPGRGAGRLGEHVARVEAFRGEAGRQVAELWEMLQEEEGEASSASLEDLVGYVASPEDEAWWDAVRLALWTDQLHFRRRGERFEPLPARIVEERKRQVAAGRARQEQLEAMVSALRSALQAEGGGDGGAAPAGASPDLDKAVELLDVAAAHLPEHPHQKRAAELVAAFLGQAPKVPARAAFDILVKLGVYGPDENLLLRRHGIRPTFPAEVLAEAEEIAAAVTTRAAGATKELFVVAIDDATTRDVDDALAIEVRPGATVVHVLITDLAAHLPLSSKTADEARRRGTSVYLPDRQVSMLPPCLSHEALSLLEGTERDVLDFRVSLTDEGSPYDVQVEPVRVRVDRQVTYEEADGILAALEAGDDCPGGADSPLARTLAGLARVSRLLRADRIARGAVPHQPDDFKIHVEEEGEVHIERIPPDSPSRDLVAELMVLAGAQAARYCKEQGIPVVYRVQERGGDNDLPTPPPDARLELADIFDRLRGMRPAELRLTPGPHAGLAAAAYTQVTSPLRRFQDYVTHLQLRRHLKAGAAPLPPQELLRLFAALEETQRTCTRIMRESDAYWVLKHYAARRGSVVQAAVISRMGDRLRLFLKDSGYQLNWSPEGSVEVGDVIDVVIASADARRSKLVVRRTGSKR